MYKSVLIFLLAIVTPFCARGQQPGGTLTSTLASQGLAGAKLERRYGNHLLVPVSINNRRGALMIDTGSPYTLIDRNSVNTFGLTVEKTDSSVGGLFGHACGQQPGGTLTSTLASQGLAGAKLERRYGNHLLVPVSINNRRGALMIDTGSPYTLIDRNSVNTFGLTVEKTDSSVGGLFGHAWERYGTSKVKS